MLCEAAWVQVASVRCAGPTAALGAAPLPLLPLLCGWAAVPPGALGLVVLSA